MESEAKYITAQEAARRLGITRNTVYGWILRGIIETHRYHPKGQHYIPASEIKKLQVFLENNR